MSTGLAEVDLDQLRGVCGFRARTAELASEVAMLLADGQPMTLRGLFYRAVSAGLLPSTDREHYQRLGRIMTIMREAGIVPFRWLVDSGRDTERSSSWSGLQDFADTVAQAYRKDFWASLPEYVHVFVEKDAMAGVLRPTARYYDVPLSIVRGYVSVSMAAEVAEDWRRIEKPITAYYLGDYDPSGFDLERVLQEKLSRYSGRDFTWCRLGVTEDDFDEFNLLPLQPKKGDRRTAGFLASGRTICAELDAIPADALRDRLSDAILDHIPVEEWEHLQQTEAREKQQWNDVMAQLRARV